MKKRLFCGIFPLIALILETLPFGAVCHFASPEGSGWRRTYSYWSPIPFGYGNVGPLLTAVITCLGLIALIRYGIKGGKQWASLAKYLLFLGAVVSLAPLIQFGVRFFSLVGGGITLALLAGGLVLAFQKEDG